MPSGPAEALRLGGLTLATAMSRSFRYVTLCAAGAPFLDGFGTASGAVFVSLLADMTATETALLTALPLACSFLGSLAAGPLAERFGSLRFFQTVFGWSALLCAFAWLCPYVATLIFARALTGFFVGLDYPISQALVAESLPLKLKTRALGWLMVAWNVGALAAIAIAPPFLSGEFAWPGLAGVAALAAGAFALLRCGAKTEPALAHVHAHPTSAPRSALTAAHYKRILFCAGFWLCQTLPVTIMMFYAAPLLKYVTGEDAALVHNAWLYGFFLLGALPALKLATAQHCRSLLISTFALMALGLLIVVFCGLAHPKAASVGLVLFALAYGLQTPLDFVYPGLLFESAVKARSIGIITAVSRIGATAAAFAFPWLAARFAPDVLLLAGSAVLAAGFLIALGFAPRVTGAHTEERVSL